VKWLTVVVLSAFALMVMSGAEAWAEDSDIPRWYLQLKFRDTDSNTGVHDYYGFGIGANLNRYLGFELSGDHFEIFPKVRGLGTVGEYGVFALMPQVRVRYPVWHDRLVPYVMGGAGVALTDFNDKKLPAFPYQVRSESSTWAATLGAGVEYFVADNIALGVEFKYLFAGDQTLKVGTASTTVNASNPLVSFGLRMFYPELRPATPVEFAEPAPARFYLGFRIGGAIPTNNNLATGVENRPIPSAIGGSIDEYYGLAFGLDFGRYLGAELPIDGYEVVMGLKGVGSIREYAIYTFVPQLRLRYPIWGGRLVPYAIGGVGIGHAESNDRKPSGANISVSANDNGIAASVGGGIEYFLMRNIAAGVESKWSYTGGHTITINGNSQTATAQAAVVTFGIRVYFYDFGR
jgi:opacity protein-like surface antigen